MLSLSRTRSCIGALQLDSDSKKMAEESEEAGKNELERALYSVDQKVICGTCTIDNTQ